MNDKLFVRMNKGELLEELRMRNIGAAPDMTNAQLVDLLQTAEAGGVVPNNLPPAGHERSEELRRRTDGLEEEAERRSDEQEVYGIDPSKLQSDREIISKLQQAPSSFFVSDAQPGMRYKWVYFGRNGNMVWAAKTLGWRVVTGPDPEACEYKETDGTRRIGDVLLMKIPEERALLLDEQAEQRRRLREESAASRLIELGEKVRDKGILVHTHLEDVPRGKGSMMDVVQKRAARQTNVRQVDQMLRAGKVPGIPTPGVE